MPVTIPTERGTVTWSRGRDPLYDVRGGISEASTVADFAAEALHHVLIGKI